MITDQIFHQEQRFLKKLSLLVTIPCAILPIMMAGFGIMQPQNEPLLFYGDKILFALVYLLYAGGLFFSWKQHHNLVPALLFASHLASQLIFSLGLGAGWLPYAILFSIMLTSIVNQYCRTGSVACREETCSLENL